MAKTDSPTKPQHTWNNKKQNTSTFEINLSAQEAGGAGINLTTIHRPFSFSAKTSTSKRRLHTHRGACVCVQNFHVYQRPNHNNGGGGVEGYAH